MYRMVVTPDEYDRLLFEALEFAMQSGSPGWVDCVRKVVGDERTDAALAAGGAVLRVEYPKIVSEGSLEPLDGLNARNPSAGAGLDAWERL